MANQRIPPVSDVNAGGWTPSDTGPLYATLDESTPNDGDFIASGLNPTSDTVEIQFAPALDPGVLDGFIVTYRIWGTTGTKITVSLICGTTLIRSWIHDPAPSGPNVVDGQPFWQYDQPLAPSEAALITDYSNLRLRFEAGPATVSTIKNGSANEALFAVDAPSVKGSALTQESGTARDTSNASLPVSHSVARAEAGVATDSGVGVKQSVAGSFKTVTQQTTGSNPLPAGTPQQYVTELKLHGSSGGNYTFGNRYFATCDTTMGFYDDNPFYFWVQNVGGFAATPIGQMQPLDSYTLVSGSWETYWFGYSHVAAESPKIAHPYTEVRLDAMYDWILDNNPQLSRTKVTAFGNSMGAWGSMSYVIRRPEKFAAVFATQPRWRDPYLPDWNRSAPAVSGVFMPSGQLYTDHMDAVAYVADVNNKLPFISWTIGSLDEFATWQEQKDAYDALIATNRAFVFAWNGGNHGNMPNESIITNTYNRRAFELGKGYPILMNSTLNQNPHIHPVGGHNIGFSWTNIVETASTWSCTLANTSACAVDVLPYSSIFTATVSPIRVTLAANIAQTVTFSSAVPISASMAESVAATDANNANVLSSSTLVTNSSPTNIASSSRQVCFYNHHYSGQPYERWIVHTVFTTNAFGNALPAAHQGGYGMVFNATTLVSGARIALAYPQYRVFMSPDGLSRGTEVATANLPTDAIPGPYQEGRCRIRGTLPSTAAMPDGPYMLTIVPYTALGVEVTSPIETYIPYWIWVDRLGEARDHPMVVFQNGSFDWSHPSDWGGAYREPYLWSLVPKTKLKTRQVPLSWTYVPVVDADPTNAHFPGIFQGGEPFSNACNPNELTRINYAYFGDIDDGNAKLPSITSRNIVVTENMQSYFSTDWFAKTPQQPLLDGPRGVGTMQNSTSMWVSHSGVQYGIDSFAFWKIGLNGTKTTLAGLRHTGPYPAYWEDRGNVQGPYYGTTRVQDQTSIPGVEVVGDWTAVPGGSAKHFPWEAWGLLADYRTTQQDYAATQVNLPPFGLLPPHLATASSTGPVFYSTCRQTSAAGGVPTGAGRILKYQFSKNVPGTPPVVTEFANTVMDPWGIATDQNGTLFVTERTRHAISKWDMDTGAYLGDVLSNPSAGSGPLGAGAFGQMADGVADRRWKFPTSYYAAPYDLYHPNLTLPRAQQIVAPEGCAYMDGFLYWAAYAQGEVRRINLTTGVIEVCCRPLVGFNNQSLYMYIALSDGTWGPRSTIIVSTYDNQSNGPRAYPPALGTAPDGTPLTHANQWIIQNNSLVIPRGPGGRTTPVSYTTAANIHNGMLVYSGALPGLSALVKATLGEPATDEVKLTRGYQKWRAGNYRLLYGNAGYGFVDIALPWGVDTDIDYYLQICGHVYGS